MAHAVRAFNLGKHADLGACALQNTGMSSLRQIPAMPALFLMPSCMPADIMEAVERTLLRQPVLQLVDHVRIAHKRQRIVIYAHVHTELDVQPVALGDGRQVGALASDVQMPPARRPPLCCVAYKHTACNEGSTSVKATTYLSMRTVTS